MHQEHGQGSQSYRFYTTAHRCHHGTDLITILLLQINGFHSRQSKWLFTQLWLATSCCQVTLGVTTEPVN